MFLGKNSQRTKYFYKHGMHSSKSEILLKNKKNINQMNGNVNRSLKKNIFICSYEYMHYELTLVSWTSLGSYLGVVSTCSPRRWSTVGPRPRPWSLPRYSPAVRHRSSGKTRCNPRSLCSNLWFALPWHHSTKFQ